MLLDTARGDAVAGDPALGARFRVGVPAEAVGFGAVSTAGHSAIQFGAGG